MYDRHLSELDKHLQKQKEKGPWIIGEHFTLADIIWTTLIDRCMDAKIGPSMIENRIYVYSYYKRVKGRKSYKNAIDNWKTEFFKMGNKLLGRWVRENTWFKDLLMTPPIEYS